MKYNKDEENYEEIECPVLGVNKLCLFFPSRRCWQIMEPAPAIRKPCEGPVNDFTVGPCISYVEYWEKKKVERQWVNPPQVSSSRKREAEK